MSTRLALVLSLVACAARQPPEPLPEPPFTGFLAERSPPAPLGPASADESAWHIVDGIATDKAFSASSTADELRAALQDTSQMMLSAAAPALFRTGVYVGNTAIVALACDSQARVTTPSLRRSDRLDVYADACHSLRIGPPANHPCPEGARLIVEGYAAIAAGNELSGRATMSRGLASIAACEEGRPLLRSAVPSKSDGFPIVVALQMLGAHPDTWIAGTNAPEPAREINDAYLKNRKSIASNTR